MTQYRPKPIAVDAVRWTGTEFEGGKPIWLPDVQPMGEVMPAAPSLVQLPDYLVWSFGNGGACNILPGWWAVNQPPCAMDDVTFQASYEAAERKPDPFAPC